MTIKGASKGSYDSSTLSGGNDASVRGAETAKGQVDHVVVRPGEASLQFETGAASASVAYDLKTTNGKVVKTASIAMTAHDGGEDESELSGGTVRLAHDGGATKASVTLGSVGAGLPASVQTAPLALGRGTGRFTLKVHVPRLHAGARVRVVTMLLDESANLASVRRTATTHVSRG